MQSFELTKKELKEMTGYTRASDQKAWLKRNKIHHTTKGVSGDVCVLRSWAENAPFYNAKIPPASTKKLGGFAMEHS